MNTDGTISAPRSLEFDSVEFASFNDSWEMNSYDYYNFERIYGPPSRRGRSGGVLFGESEEDFLPSSIPILRHGREEIYTGARVRSPVRHRSTEEND